MEIIAHILSAVYVSYITWVAYLSIMHLKKVRDADQLPKVTMYLSLPLLIIGFALDFLINLIIGTILFLEIPSGWLLTDRLQRHIGKDNWRGKMARWICTNLLEPFDEGHCDD